MSWPTRKSKNKPAAIEASSIDASQKKVEPRDFPAGNVADIKSTSLFLHSDGGKATKEWWANTKGITA